MKRRPLNLKRALSSGGVFFPWERKKGFFGILGRARVRVLVGIVAVFVVVVWIRGREEKAAGIRSTRATITPGTSSPAGAGLLIAPSARPQACQWWKRVSSR